MPNKPSTDQLTELFVQMGKGQITREDIQELIQKGTRAGLKDLFEKAISLASSLVPVIVIHSPADDEINYVDCLQQKVVCLVVEALVKAGEWKRARNLIADGAPWNPIKARALVAAGDINTSPAEIQALLADISCSGNPYRNDEALTVIVNLFPREEALKMVETMTSVFYRVQALTILGGHDDLKQARLLAAKIKEEAGHTYLKAEAWVMIARVSGAASDRKEAYRAAREDWDKPFRIEYLAMVYSMTRQGVLVARQMVHQLSDPFSRAPLWASIGQTSGRIEDFRLALREVEKINNGPSWKAEAAARIALSLANVLSSDKEE